jgi:uncharacterized membrane protein
MYINKGGIMAHAVTALFEDSKLAGEAIADLKAKGYAESISIVTQDEETGETEKKTVGQHVDDGAVVGGLIGSLGGAVAGIAAGAASFVVPGVGLLVMGPLATAVSATAAGAAVGGITGALVDAGIAEDQAKAYEDAVSQGEVLVSVAPEHDKEEEVISILRRYNAYDMVTSH